VTGQYNHELKLDRALQHLQNLSSEIAIWLESKPYRLIHDFDVESNKKLLIAEPLEPVPPQLALMVGDCLHNFRSALDNLVYELAIAYTGIDPLPERRARALEFPIFTDRAMKPRECRNKIGCIHPDAQAFIKELQPYEQGGEDASEHVLSILHNLSVKDKHRFPHLGFFSPRTITLYVAGHAGAINVEPNWGAIEGRAEVIARYFSLTGNYAEVDMQNPPTFFVAFGKGSPDAIYGARVENVLDEIRKWIVNKVIPPLARYLPASGS
jgi:hypothetical protein